MVSLFLTILACNAVAQLTSSHSSTTNLTSLSPSPATAAFDAACPARLQDILSAAKSGGDVGGSSVHGDSYHEVSYLVVYEIRGDELGKRDDLFLPEKVDENVDSRASHETIWDTFKSLIPAENRSFVTQFSVLTDGSNNILAGVSPTYDDPSEWTLKVDVVDAGDPYSLSYSLLHEYGHLLTLNASQVPPDELVFYHPDDTSIQSWAIANCPRYFTGEGCSNPGSYMNEFFNKYWSSFYAGWQETHRPDGQEIQWDLLDDFYQVHEDQFLTSYAASSPEEDIAESWVYFVLAPKPEPTSIANQKILFFYAYPELVALRQEIVYSLCTSFPES